MSQRLLGGHFLGTTARRRRVGDLVLVEARYAPGLRLPRHSHEHAYLCLVRRGGYAETFGARQRECGPRTVAYHPPEEVHAQHMHQAEVWSFNVELPTPWLRQVRERAPILDGPADFHGGPAAALALRLYQEFRDGDAHSALMIEGLLLQLLAEASRLAERGGPAGAPRWLGRLREILHARYAEPLSLGELAAAIGLHPVYLATAFRRHCGCGVGEYLRRLRVEEACRRLAATAEPLAEVALAAGFSDQSHLNRLFRRHLGMTPAAYRKSAGRP